MQFVTDRTENWQKHSCKYGVYSIHRYHGSTFRVICCFDRLHNNLIDCIIHDSLHNCTKLEFFYAGDHYYVFKLKRIMQLITDRLHKSVKVEWIKLGLNQGKYTPRADLIQIRSSLVYV